MGQPYRGEFLSADQVRYLLESKSYVELRAMLERELNVNAAMDLSLLLSYKRPVERISALEDDEVSSDEIEMYFSAKSQLRRCYRSGMTSEVDFEAWENENGLSDIIEAPYEWEIKFDRRCHTFCQT